MAKVQKILVGLRDTLTTLTSVGDELIAVDAAGEPAEQLQNIAKIGEKLQQLNTEVENLEKKLQAPQDKVSRPPVDENMSDRIAQLQKNLEEKKQQLMARAKVQTLSPEVTSLTEDIRQNVEEMEKSLPQSLDEQNAALHNLEVQKQRLERVLEAVPEGSEGDELRARAKSWLERLSEQLKRLAAALGDRLAALTAFNAAQSEVQSQLSAFDLPKVARSAESSAQECTDRLHKLQVLLTLFMFRPDFQQRFELSSLSLGSLSTSLTLKMFRIC